MSDDPVAIAITWSAGALACVFHSKAFNLRPSGISTARWWSGPIRWGNLLPLASQDLKIVPAPPATICQRTHFFAAWAAFCPRICVNLRPICLNPRTIRG